MLKRKAKKPSGINHQVALNVMDRAYLSVCDSTKAKAEVRTEKFEASRSGREGGMDGPANL